jgi:hypothetical protein
MIMMILGEICNFAAFGEFLLLPYARLWNAEQGLE